MVGGAEHHGRARTRFRSGDSQGPGDALGRSYPRYRLILPSSSTLPEGVSTPPSGSIVTATAIS